MTFADAKQRFSNRAADYVRYRPGYPAEVLPLLRSECGLKSGHVIADIGSGTGFLSELFLKNGNRVYGVEPNEAMRQAGEEYLAAYDGFVSINASAEATTLGNASVDFVTAGQAFHWFEPSAARREFIRILKPLGWIVVLWNDRQMDTPFASAYENLLVKSFANFFAPIISRGTFCRTRKRSTGRGSPAACAAVRMLRRKATPTTLR
jgi:ubiquinone/menaquinone biosynthesis C-methylase UbiE